MLQDMLEYPELIHGVLATITKTTIDSTRANIGTDVSGFFFVEQCTSYGFMDDTMFTGLCKPYDIQIISAYKDVAWSSVVHIHGSNIRFDEVSAYLRSVISWHDRQNGPSLKETREKCPKAFLGGPYEGLVIVGPFLKYDSIISRQETIPDMIKKHIRGAIDMANGKGLLIDPGCMVGPHSPEENLRAMREAVERS